MYHYLCRVLQSHTKINIMKNWRIEFEEEINEILRKRHELEGFAFVTAINLKKLNANELMYFYRMVKYKLKEVEQ